MHTRALRMLGVVGLLIGGAGLTISCTASATRVESPTDVTVNVTTTSVGVVGGGFAAMDEVPVTSGELRLVMPKVVDFQGAQRDMIGFPLEHTAITAQIGGMMAVYRVEQTFANPFDDAIDAVYAFPLGADGAVSGYEMTIGERTIKGEIRTKEDARRVFDQARSQGHTAGLLEQAKPNIFTQSVANIAPHESVKITVTYVEMLAYDDGAYESVVPLTIGPRYLPQDRVGTTPVAAHAAGGAGRPGVTSMPYVDATRASSTVSFTAEIDAGVPLVGLASPSHDLRSQPLGPTRTRVTLAEAGEIPNRDLILRYVTAGPKTTVGLLAHRTDTEGYFVLTVQPKGNGNYRTVDIAGREVLIVIDRSGSMNGEPIAQAKAVASGILGTLTERDTFNIIGFASGVDAMSPALLRGDPANVRDGLDYLRKMTPGGGTEMELGVAAMLQAPPNGRVRHVYFITDGFVGNDDVVIGAANKLLGTNRIFTVGIGSAPNRSLLDRLAKAGRGFASYLALTEEAQALVDHLVVKSAQPYLTDVTVDWAGLDARPDHAGLVPDVYLGQPLVITGRYTKPGHATVRIRATAAGQPVTIPLEIELPARSDLEPVASLWARRQLDELTNVALYEDVRQPITEIGLKFHLVTAYTSFVAVDRSRVVGTGDARIVEQPSVVPEGVDLHHTVSEQPVYHADPPSSSRPSRSSYDDGDSFFSGSGGPEETTFGLLAAMALLGALWALARRFV